MAPSCLNRFLNIRASTTLWLAVNTTSQHLAIGAQVACSSHQKHLLTPKQGCMKPFGAVQDAVPASWKTLRCALSFDFLRPPPPLRRLSAFGASQQVASQDQSPGLLPRSCWHSTGLTTGESTGGQSFAGLSWPTSAADLPIWISTADFLQASPAKQLVQRVA